MIAIPELLAPVGSWEAMVAAIQNGADAIYLGGKMFSARAYANNFDLEELERTVDYAHLRGVKVYVTVNTLLSDQELPEGIKFCKSLYELGVDAVIIQDLGIARLIKKMVPDLEIHASTQMTIHNLGAVKLLHNFGFERIVLARELSLEDIKSIDENTPVELEVFIHGALCICYSGLCLMSSLIGGRSGNRGRCAQPCRLKYKLVNEAGKELVGDGEGEGLHLLSPKDLNMIEHLPELMEAGIDSLKIEGRMKRPEYVATVIRSYREAINNCLQTRGQYTVKEEHLKDLKQIFNRDFTPGYFFGFKGKEMMSYKRPNNRGLRLGRVASYDFHKKEVQITLDEPLLVGDGIEFWVSKGGRKGIVVSKMKVNNQSVEEALPGTTVTIGVAGAIRTGDRVFKTNDSRLMQKALQSYSSTREIRKIPLQFEVEAKLSQPLLIKVTDNSGLTGAGKTAFIAETAIKRALTEEVIEGQLNRLGNTPYEIGTLKVEIEDNLMVPLGEINEARRLAIADLEQKKLADTKPASVNGKSFSASLRDLQEGLKGGKAKFNPIAVDQVKLNVLVGSLDAVKAAIDAGADAVYFGGDNFNRGTSFKLEDINEAFIYANSKGKKFVLSTPRILQKAEMNKYLSFVAKLSLASYDGILTANLGLFEEFKDFTGELYADYPLNIFNSQTAEFFRDFGCKRVALSPELTLEQLKIFNVSIDREYLVHGNLTMMVSEYCGLGSALAGINCKEKCPQPCKKDKYGLKDRLKFVFPIEVDQFCHMHIFNPKELCLVEDIPEILAAGINNLRVELKRDEPKKVAQVVKAYKEALKDYFNNPKGFNGEVYKEKLEALTPNGITKGHLYRGVL